MLEAFMFVKNGKNLTLSMCRQRLITISMCTPMLLAEVHHESLRVFSDVECLTQGVMSFLYHSISLVNLSDCSIYESHSEDCLSFLFLHDANDLKAIV